ncbi:MdtA/MuxA family multidrug efflux RND transporter periplasmic adaptor subunit [Advenella sp. WQ 585]|uniref:MdtA/MuxA family multidrug efflux RND transporter periplasmic adaptor subunit n=1 Tax=Advenella mandrilli TaxID=2800330 RepID=A0ABS1EEF1_9BURK|nr:MdtA/MuxA family multidrug efflux RND transporter periplasmic adaptor subunit [Advenella mandrilli]MBK1780795.1 MdtA/MuxA family multidrug efflux RND transporter periplasmic adaptor subunit [Advenella mandrilli]
MANQTQENVKKPSNLFRLAIFVVIVIGGYFGWQYFFNASTNSNAPAQSKNAGEQRSGSGPRSGGSRAAGQLGMVTPVRVETVQQKDMEVRVPGLGTVTAFNTVAVRSQVSGPIVQIAFTEGQNVKQGDLLVEIDPRPFQIQLQQAQGQQARNEAELTNARQDLKRYQTLYKQDSIARQQVDTQAALVKRLEAQAYSDKAAVDEAQLNLEYTKVLAPIDGRLGLRNIDIGNLVTANAAEALVTITQVKPVSVVFSIPEVHLAEVAAQYTRDVPLEVTLMDRDNLRELATGVLASMDNLVDVATGTLKLKANFANEDESLFPNQFVNTRLKIRQVPQAMTISTDAIQNSSSGPFVFRAVADNTAEMVPVKLGVTDGIYTQLLDGVALGDLVITEGVDRLRNGSKIEIIQ